LAPDAREAIVGCRVGPVHPQGGVEVIERLIEDAEPRVRLRDPPVILARRSEREDGARGPQLRVLVLDRCRRGYLRWSCGGRQLPHFGDVVLERFSRKRRARGLGRLAPTLHELTESLLTVTGTAGEQRYRGQTRC